MTGRGRVATVAGVLVLAVVAALARLPFLGRTPTSDEGGFLMLAAQWAPGPSLYGHYWVDRPPLLVGLFALASACGGLLPLRLLGIAVVVASVGLAGTLGALVSPSRRRGAAWTTAAVAAVFLAMPVFGISQVDGELLAVPFVLAGLVLVVVGLRNGGAAAAVAWVAAGACAGAAVLVKQNVIDVAVVAGVLLLITGTRGRWRGAVGRGGLFAAGVLATVTGLVAWAATRGTSTSALLDAVVTFRAQAATVIGTSSSSATPARFGVLLLALAVSGAPAYVALCAWSLRRPARPTSPHSLPDLRWPAAALLTWETFAVAAGGSYWLHYLTGLVPGLVLVTAAVLPRPEGETTTLRRARTGVLVWAVAVAATSGTVAATRPGPEHGDAAVASYLRAYAGPADTAVVAYGHADILEQAGLNSPYPYLWSLPVRVRDPRLTTLVHVLRGPHRPAWVVLDGEDLTTWGVHPGRADRVLDARYHEVADLAGYDIYRVDH